ncbi:MAG TPA: hypothetical protein VLA66_06875, partial [Thermoanaerobaculia bacterium]|nr:hypothetical protein [Thermoanaerobaculia bacterium]
MRTSSALPRRRDLPPNLTAALIALVVAIAGATSAAGSCLYGNDPYTQQFRIGDCTFADVGDNPFVPLVPGTRTRLRGPEDGERIDLWITVL